MKVLNLQFKHNYLFLGGTSYMFRLKYLADYGKNEKNSQISFCFLISLVAAIYFNRKKYG
jgi:hypothetical protein